MKVLVSGSSGLIGSSLVPFLTSSGHNVTRLVRSKSTSTKADTSEIVWDFGGREIAPPSLVGLETVVHLAGENIAEGRWSEAKKIRIRESRTKGTQRLCEALARLAHPPGVFICASAIGYYGDRGEEILREDSKPGSGFLPDVCREWEGATATAAQRRIRVVNLRFGVVLSPSGGALAKMLPPFRMGIGGRLGNGKQYMSWIALDDAVGVIHHALVTEALNGPVNAVSPSPVTNLEFTKTLGRVLSRPTLFPVPTLAARMAFGEMADALLLASARVVPVRLQQTGYRFQYPDLEGALRHLLIRPSSG
jgi:uncharacterized protein (TIGR01777 family)